VVRHGSVGYEGTFRFDCVEITSLLFFFRDKIVESMSGD
jgi:hypothetical protein